MYLLYIIKRINSSYWSSLNMPATFVLYTSESVY